MSIRPGWFWHASQDDQVRSPANLMELYLASVGRGAKFLLNVPPDRRGRLHENDVASLRAFGAHLRATFATNLAADARLEASDVRGDDDVRYGPRHLLDDDRWSAWVTGDFVTTPRVELTLPEPRTFDLIRLREDIRLGQRVEGVAVDAWQDGAWREIAAAQSVGACRLWRVDPVTTGPRPPARHRQPGLSGAVGLRALSRAGDRRLSPLRAGIGSRARMDAPCPTPPLAQLTTRVIATGSTRAKSAPPMSSCAGRWTACARCSSTSAGRSCSSSFASCTSFGFSLEAPEPSGWRLLALGTWLLISVLLLYGYGNLERRPFEIAWTVAIVATTGLVAATWNGRLDPFNALWAVLFWFVAIQAARVRRLARAHPGSFVALRAARRDRAGHGGCGGVGGRIRADSNAHAALDDRRRLLVGAVVLDATPLGMAAASPTADALAPRDRHQQWLRDRAQARASAGCSRR